MWKNALGVEDPTVADDPSASMTSAPLADISGSVLHGRYRAARLVGSGSMGDVYDGVDLSTGGRVALKVLKPERAVREVFRHRFMREARSAVLIDHPNVVDVFDFGETPEGLLFIAMEFLEGEDLSAYLGRNGRLHWPHAVVVLRQIAAALAAAHDCGVVHRDVKPSNILLRQDGSGELIVKLLDFGVAKLDNQMVSRILTRAEDVVGTVLYMSPEQAEGHTADLRSDVYAFGVTAFQTLTGDVPFPGRDLFKVMSAHLNEPPPDPSSGAPEMPPWGSQFVLRCLEKAPHSRYQSMHDVLAVLCGSVKPDIVSEPRPGTPIADPRDAERERHPPLMEDPLPMEARAPSVASNPADAFDEAPTAYFHAQAPVPAAAAPATTLAPSRQPEPASEVATTTFQHPHPFIAPVPVGPPRTHTQPMQIDPNPLQRASPFRRQQPLSGQTVPALAHPEDPEPFDPRPFRGIYVVLAVGVLAVVAALAMVVG